LTETVQTGTRVRLSQAYRDYVAAWQPFPWEDGDPEEVRWQGPPGRLAEFGDRVGVVVEVDQGIVHVEWQPSGLLYGYKPEWLVTE